MPAPIGGRVAHARFDDSEQQSWVPGIADVPYIDRVGAGAGCFVDIAQNYASIMAAGPH